MKYVKMLGLLAVAAAALMAFAGTASATVLTSPEGTTYTGEIVATSTNSELDGVPVTIKCSHSEVKGTVSSHGGAEVTGNISSLTFTGCNYTTTVKTAGSLSINGSNVVRSYGATIEIESSIGKCIYTTNGTSIGTLTEGAGAVHDINSSIIPRTEGNFLCGTSGTWTGSYSITTPSSLWVD